MPSTPKVIMWSVWVKLGIAHQIDYCLYWPSMTHPYFAELMISTKPFCCWNKFLVWPSYCPFACQGWQWLKRNVLAESSGFFGLAKSVQNSSYCQIWLQNSCFFCILVRKLLGLWDYSCCSCCNLQSKFVADFQGTKLQRCGAAADHDLLARHSGVSYDKPVKECCNAG